MNTYIDHDTETIWILTGVIIIFIPQMKLSDDERKPFYRFFLFIREALLRFCRRAGRVSLYYIIDILRFDTQLQIIGLSVQSVVDIVRLHQFLFCLFQEAVILRIHSHARTDYEKCVVDDSMNRVCVA